MRRKEKEITDRAEIDAIIARATVCHLAMIDGDRPYLLPISFGYADNTLYFHSAAEGRKIDLLRRSPEVCFQFEIEVETVRAPQACHWGARFRSVVGTGRARFIDDPQEKRRALALIMRHYAGAEESFTFPDQTVEQTLLFRVSVETITGKQSGYA